MFTEGVHGQNTQDPNIFTNSNQDNSNRCSGDSVQGNRGGSCGSRQVVGGPIIFPPNCDRAMHARTLGASCFDVIRANKLRQAAARENALADEANKLRQAAAAREKALADKLRQAAAQEKALADKANERCRAITRKKALADEAYEQRWAATRKKVLAIEVNKQRRRPSTTVDGQPQTACLRSQPRLCVGCRHGPRAPNPQEHLLCRQRHRPRAPNQSTVNGWA
jgi:hypothetical protein